MEVINYLEENSKETTFEKEFLAKLTEQVGDVTSEVSEKGFRQLSDGFSTQKQLVNQLSKLLREEQIIVADEKLTRDKEIAALEINRMNQLN